VSVKIPRVVSIRMPLDQSFAEAMRRIRDWFDQNKVQPDLFRQTGIDRFEVKFASETEAHLFDEAFG
jgi:hypothetical protein